MIHLINHKPWSKKMNKTNNEFQVVSIDQNDTQSLIVFEINQVSKMVRKTNVGQFVKSYPFELNYPTSIGRSKWVVILFLNGQYEHGGKPNELIWIYLKMVHCEQQSAVFKFDVKFQLGSENGVVIKNNQSICFDNVRTRWIGTKLVNINEMIINGSRFIQNDTLILSVYLNENSPKRVAAATSSYNNNILFESESYAKAETESKYGNLPVITSPIRHQRYSNQSNTGSVYDINHNSNLPRSSCYASDSKNASSPLGNSQKAVCDSNSNYVDNEFSDDEDVTPKPTDSRNGFVSTLLSGLQNFFGKYNSN